MQIDYKTDEAVAAAIGRLGRTEDVQFSPAGDRLAVAGFNENRITIFGIEIDWEGDQPKLELSSALELESQTLDRPHGLCWIDDGTLMVANRKAWVDIFEVPSQQTFRVQSAPLRTLGEEAADLLKTPGSVSVMPVGLDLFEVLICNNYVQDVSKHLIDARDNYALVASEILVRDDIDIPDGVAHSPSGRWFAVSNHGWHNVLVYRNEDANRSGDKAVLGGINYPHGVRFAADERTILVADAGAPFVHLFRSDGNWIGEIQPDQSVRVMSDECFKRGSNRPDEGGPKGLDLTRDGKLLVVSCEEQPFAFFDMRQVLGPLQPLSANAKSEVERARSALLACLASDRAKLDEATAAVRRAGELDMGLIMDSRSWRMTAPLRSAMASLRRAKHRALGSRSDAPPGYL